MLYLKCSESENLNSIFLLRIDNAVKDVFGFLFVFYICAACCAASSHRTMKRGKTVGTLLWWNTGIIGLISKIALRSRSFKIDQILRASCSLVSIKTRRL